MHDRRAFTLSISVYGVMTLISFICRRLYLLHQGIQNQRKHPLKEYPFVTIWFRPIMGDSNKKDVEALLNFDTLRKYEIIVNYTTTSTTTQRNNRGDSSGPSGQKADLL